MAIVAPANAHAQDSAAEPAPVPPGHVPVIVDTPSEPSTFPTPPTLPPMSEEDAYTHAYLKWKSRRMRNSLIGSSVMTAVGTAFVITAELTLCSDTDPNGEMTFDRCSQGGKAMVVLGYPLVLFGSLTMLGTGIALGLANRDLRQFEQRAARRKTRALRWDPTRSGFVF